MNSFAWLFGCSLLVLGGQSGFANDLASDYQPVDHLLNGVRDLLEPSSLWILGVGSALTLGSLAVDQSVQGSFSGLTGGFSRFGNFWGSGIPEVAIASATLGYGYFAGRPHELEAGEAHFEALLVAFVGVEALKYSVRRERPDGSDHLSFPSAHTAAAFTTAANLMDMYGPSVGVPALLLGVATGVSRIATNEHWLSDTVFGATLGYAVGHSFAGHHLRALEGRGVAVVPYFDDRADFGVVAKVRIE
jgi:membrane-associated phospholipid phosphatase